MTFNPHFLRLKVFIERKIIVRPLVICCSQRFKEELYAFVKFLEKRGVMVHYPNFRYHSKTFIKKEEYQRMKARGYKDKTPGLVRQHIDKIRKIAKQGGICLIFNPLSKKRQSKKFGYIGFNTVLEMGEADGVEMNILLLRPNEEPSTTVVAHGDDDRRHIFTLEFPKADPMDFDFVWDKWLKRWLQ